MHIPFLTMYLITSTLHAQWILDSDMFRSAMAHFNLDMNKLPLGTISKSQVQKGFDALSEIDAAMRSNADQTVLSVSAIHCLHLGDLAELLLYVCIYLYMHKLQLLQEIKLLWMW
jgi:hypothetical protein